MHGLRSGRLMDATAASQSDLPGHANMERSQPPQLVTRVKTEPIEYSLPSIQSPYFHGGMASHPMLGGGGSSHSMLGGGGSSHSMLSGGGSSHSMLSGGGSCHSMLGGGGSSHSMLSGGGSSHSMLGGGGSSHSMLSGGDSSHSMLGGGGSSNPMLGGGGLEDIEDFNFDAGYLISSKLSEMVATGAYSYPSPPTIYTPSRFTQPHPLNRIKTEPGTTSCNSHPPALNNHHIGIKTEPGVELPPLKSVKQEPSTTPAHEATPSATPTGRVKDEPGAIEGECWEPPLWRVQYRNICQMRSETTAPVDTHGCFMLAQKDVPPHVRRYQVLVSLMLSSQTKDQITGKAMTNLKKHGLTVENILITPQEDIAKMINMVGFWHKKSDYIKRTTDLVASKYNSDIPTTLKELMSLPGVGPKMANLVMDFAWGQVTGIAVDTHVHRISHRLGWMQKQTPSPEATRLALEKWLPKSEWSNLNLMMVGFGQTLCAPQRPHCQDCLNRNICPSSLACNDATMGGLAGHYTPTALTTGKKKKKGKALTSIKTESLSDTPPTIEGATPTKKKRKLNKPVSNVSV